MRVYWGLTKLTNVSKSPVTCPKTAKTIDNRADMC